MLHCPQSLLKRSLHRSSKHTLQTLGISLKILLLCEETHYSLKERNRGNKAALVKRLKYLIPPAQPCQTCFSSLPDDNWDWNTFSGRSLIQWVNCNMGKTWMGPKLCGDSATETLRIALCGRAQKGNVLLISIVQWVSVLSFKTRWLKAHPEVPNENDYKIADMSAVLWM